MIIKPAKRTESVKEYYFSVKNKEIARLNADGRKDMIINLGIGAPDGMPPHSSIDALCQEAGKSGVHKYQSYNGIPELREAIARFYSRHYGVSLDPACEIQPLTGSKEGILIISMTFLNPGDKVLIPNPGYPTYSSAARLCDAEIVYYDLCEDKGWQPDFEKLEKTDLSGVKMMWTNYPNMPTGAPATRELYEKIVAFGRRHGILICNDNPYSFVLNDNPISIMAVPGAKDVCLEMNSLSKSHNMSGWRLGMVVADGDVIKEILKVKSQMDSGIFRPLQIAAINALEQPDEWYCELNREYVARRKAACRLMDLLGAKYNPESQGLFVWGKVDRPGSEISDKFLYEAGVFITPGFIFGSNGDRYVRISLCAPVSKLEEAYERMKSILR